MKWVRDADGNWVNLDAATVITVVGEGAHAKVLATIGANTYCLKRFNAEEGAIPDYAESWMDALGLHLRAGFLPQ